MVAAHIRYSLYCGPFVSNSRYDHQHDTLKLILWLLFSYLQIRQWGYWERGWWSQDSNKAVSEFVLLPALSYSASSWVTTQWNEFIGFIIQEELESSGGSFWARLKGIPEGVTFKDSPDGDWEWTSRRRGRGLSSRKTALQRQWRWVGMARDIYFDMSFTLRHMFLWKE